ncbi:MAG: glycosyltransferase involved in cell wall biosynthesis [Acidimicrobiales bacterium]|jgi:glycosyltransferase involved in cell wall biosynthesis
MYMMRLFTEESFDAAPTQVKVAVDSAPEKILKNIQKSKKDKVSIFDDLYREHPAIQKKGRTRSRILFVTNNSEFLERDSEEQRHFCGLSDVFDEVHIIVLGLQRKQKEQTLRIAPDVWMYTTASKDFVQQTTDALSIAENQLKFTQGFRPDVIVALDPFESGIAAQHIAQKYKRTLQVHVLEDFYRDSFLQEDPYNQQRLHHANQVLKQTSSVRVATDAIKQKIKTKFKRIKDVAQLPHRLTWQEVTETPQSDEVHQSPFAFTLLFVGDLNQDTTLLMVLNEMCSLLRIPDVGLVVIGDGTAKEELREHTRLLHIDKQVLFLPSTVSITGHMQAADVLVCTDTDAKSEKVALQAAAAGLPTVMLHTPLREDLFTHKTNTFLCDPSDATDFSQKLLTCIKDVELRTQFAEKAKEMLRARIEEDSYMYGLAYRDSIEGVS